MQGSSAINKVVLSKVYAPKDRAAKTPNQPSMIENINSRTQLILEDDRSYHVEGEDGQQGYSHMSSFTTTQNFKKTPSETVSPVNVKPKVHKLKVDTTKKRKQPQTATFNQVSPRSSSLSKGASPKVNQQNKKIIQ